MSNIVLSLWAFGLTVALPAIPFGIATYPDRLKNRGVWFAATAALCVAVWPFVVAWLALHGFGAGER